MSPTVLRSVPYRFFFFASDRIEPVHVHVTGADKTAKYWFSPVRLAYNLGFAPNELKGIERLVCEHEGSIVEGVG